ncbi:MAG TPA: DUF998 domain-containing protein [Cyclobacteriaceae bacterium]|nr:DUF998 domain-containing protein [Cyclobacteriaceae bacterium]
MLGKLLLICGILSSLLYAAMNIFIPMLWEEYSSASQTVSELSAIGAPTRVVWVPLGLLYTLLIAAFGLGVRKSAGEIRSLRIAGSLLIVYGLVGLAWPPMHLRETLAAGGGTITDTLHIVFTMITVPLMLLVMGFSSAAFGKTFRIYSISTIVIQLFFGILTGIDSPGIQTNEPTPLIGVWERICIGAYMLWLVVFAVMLLRADVESQKKITKQSARILSG